MLRAEFEAVLPHLDERGQRLVMAADERSLGHGGIAAVAQATGRRGRASLPEWLSWTRGRPHWGGCVEKVGAASL